MCTCWFLHKACLNARYGIHKIITYRIQSISVIYIQKIVCLISRSLQIIQVCAMKKEKSNVFSVSTTSAAFNVGTPHGKTNIQMMFSFCSRVSSVLWVTAGIASFGFSA